MNSPLKWELRAQAALNWIYRSFEVTGFLGSAHSYSPLWGWARAYPETTGYLIPTLAKYALLRNDESLNRLAEQSIRWLEGIQFPNGAYCGGTVGNTNPSVFNTAMILFGLAKAPRPSPALERAFSWLLKVWEPDGTWRQFAYVPGFVPTYYTYALYGVLTARMPLQRPGVEDRIRQALRVYAQRFRSDGTIEDWGFRPGRSAFTHTIAYALEGFLETALALQEQDILDKTLRSADCLLREYRQAGCLAGRYGERWAGDYRFRCLTGHAQLSHFYFRLHQVTGSSVYKHAAWDLLQELMPFQNLKKSSPAYGALPGSAPFRGPYLRFRYPNWGVKFFLDALAHWQEVE